MERDLDSSGRSDLLEKVKYIGRIYTLHTYMHAIYSYRDLTFIVGNIISAAQGPICYENR